MSILSFIQQQYGFSDVQWEVTDSLFQTDRGLKKILLWKDLDLAQWHGHWRDQLATIDFVFIDRMITTKTGDRIIKYGDKWLTCHDASRSYFPMKGNEIIWGNFIGSLLSKGIQYHPNHHHPSEEEPQLTNLDEGLSSLRILKQAKWENSFNILIKCLPSAKRRLKHSYKLKNSAGNEGVPYVPPIPNPIHTKQLFGQMFWEAGQFPPSVGYESLIFFLSESLRHIGEERMVTLLETMNSHFLLRGDIGKRLLAELLYPDEWLTCLRALKNEEDPNVIEKVLNQFKEDWDQHSKLLAVLTRWLEDGREQVAK